VEEILAYLFAVAISLSGYPPIERPLAIALPYQNMLVVVCQEVTDIEGCLNQRGLVAAYLPATKMIVYRDTLDLDNNSDNSFLVHEYVHALQYADHGETAFNGCQEVYNAEREAYSIQQQYLHRTGQFLRVGEILRFFHC
jgi:hypothetical protein